MMSSRVGIVERYVYVYGRSARWRLQLGEEKPCLHLWPPTSSVVPALSPIHVHILAAGAGARVIAAATTIFVGRCGNGGGIAPID